MNQAEVKHKAPIGLRTVAIYELVKGLLVLVVGLGCLSLVHHDVQAAAEQILHRLHVDPAWYLSKKLIDTSANLNDTRLRLIALASGIYAIVRFVETYGLWMELAWAEWFAVVSAAAYLPVEVYHFMHKQTWLRAGLFIGNLIIVVYLGRLLADKRRKKHAIAQPAQTVAGDPKPL